MEWVIILLIYLLLGALVCYGVYWLLGWCGCPETPRRIITAVCILVVLLLALGHTGVFGGGWAWNRAH